jgi:transposase
MRHPTALISLTEEEKKHLEQWTRRGTSEQRLVERSRIILLANEGRTNRQIAAELDTRTARISKWRQRFSAGRLAGLGDAARSGKPAVYGEDTEKRVLSLLDQAPPKGYSQWNGNRIAECLPDISKDQIWRILRKHSILSGTAAKLVHQYRSGVWSQGRRCGRSVSRPASQCTDIVGR